MSTIVRRSACAPILSTLSLVPVTHVCTDAATGGAIRSIGIPIAWCSATGTILKFGSVGSSNLTNAPSPGTLRIARASSLSSGRSGTLGGACCRTVGDGAPEPSCITRGCDARAWPDKACA